MTTRVHASSSKTTPMNFKPIYNRYTKARGEPVFYEIFCVNCKTLVMVYQKDGDGRLLRCYHDRIHTPKGLSEKKKLICQICEITIGTFMIYKPEKRSAFRMIDGTYYKERLDE